MKEKLRSIIREEISRIFEGYDDDDYLSTFDVEDIPEMQPGSAAHQAFLKDLESEPEMGGYKEPSEEELNDIIQGLRQANLDLPTDQELIRQAEEMLHRNLTDPELEKIKRTKQRMEKIAGIGSFN